MLLMPANKKQEVKNAWKGDFLFMTGISDKEKTE